MSNPLIASKLIWDGGAPAVPDEMLPTAPTRVDALQLINSKGQMQGTNLEKLGEIASRVCYDSLGTGRPSHEFHANILKVKHLSVYEHCVFTVAVDVPMSELASFLTDCMNRPSLFVQFHPIDSPHGPYGALYARLRITLNLRHALEWRTDTALRTIITGHANSIAPTVVPAPEGKMAALNHLLVEPHGPPEQWITLFMTGSRGWSHELVRHGDWTAISQRSTRYVDENESPWVEHPLESAWRKELWPDCKPGSGMDNDPLVKEVRDRYVQAKGSLEPWLISKGIDKFTARKQARGVARGYLGNALLTEVVFSANVAQWKHMLRMRASQAADAEIRESFCKALIALQSSRYGAEFAGFALAPAPDGIGQIVMEGN